jgi:hypothetical protein
MRSSTPRRLLASGLAAGLSATATLIAAAPAQAVPGLTTITVVSSADSSPTRTVTATCPAGTVVIGGGGNAAPSWPYEDEGEVFLTGLRPIVTGSGSGYRVTATEGKTGYSGDWYVVGYAVCAPAPAGLTYVSNTSSTNSESSRTVASACPSGTHVIGSGATINGGDAYVSLQYVLPTPAELTHVAAQAHEDINGYTGSWSLTSWAVCANRLRGLELIVAGPSEHRTAALALCPAPKKTHGVGGLITGAAGQVALGGTYPWALNAGAYAYGVPTGSGSSPPWTPYAFAICAD